MLYALRILDVRRADPAPRWPRRAWGRMRYLGIFLVCLASIAFEIFLVRHFAITNWSEYGYWVISMAMAGYSVSGVVLCMFGDVFSRRAGALFYALPVAMLALMSLGYSALGLIPFNPLELQNEVLWQGQLVNIGKYYLALFPFFFASGLYVGLSFLARQEDIPKVYMADLVGAGLGAAGLLGAMHLVPPFLAPLLLLPPLTLAALTSLPAARKAAAKTGWAALALCVAAGSAWVVADANHAAYSQYKPVSSALNVEDSRVLREQRSARGHYLLVDSYAERHDPDLSNNYELLGAGGPPPALGLYRDGERMAALPRSLGYDVSYLRAALDSLPYVLRLPDRVLLAGGRGGFRPREAVMLGSGRVDTVESDPVLLAVLAGHGAARPLQAGTVLAPVDPDAAPPPEHAADGEHAPGEEPAHPGYDAPRGAATPPVLASPLTRAQAARQAGRPYRIIDVSPEYLDQGQAGKYVLTAEGVAALLGSLATRAQDGAPEEGAGILSIPMGIGELPVYALKAVTTVREGLRLAGAADPAAHIMVVRSSFTGRILASPEPFSPADVERTRAFARERSFDTPYFPGIDPARIEVFNDLPPVSFETQTQIAHAPPSPRANPQAVPSASPAPAAPSEEELALGGSFADAPETGDVPAASQDAAAPARDSLMEDITAYLRGNASAAPGGSAFSFFDLAPSTQDRPFFNEIIPPTRILDALARIEILPRQEIGYLVNVAVLAQASLFALVVFLLPLTRRGSMGAHGLTTATVLRGFGYFLCLGLGFLFIEIVLIERFTYLLGDPALAFATVLSAMLIASGLGSAFSSRFVPRPRAGIRLACGAAALSTALLALALPRLLPEALAWPETYRLALTIAVSAPLGFFMGMPFPLALSTYRGNRAAFIPWAWSVNGALSVVATPLANILAVSFGYTLVFSASLALYAAAALLAPERVE